VYDGGVRTSSERRRLGDAGRGDAVRVKREFVDVVEENVDAEEVTSVSGEVVVDGEARLSVERLRSRRLSCQQHLSNCREASDGRPCLKSRPKFKTANK